jgi:hypothetical protein
MSRPFRGLFRGKMDRKKAVTIVVAAAVVVAVARPVMHAAETVLEVLLITLAAVAVLAVTAVATFFVIRVHRRQSHTLQGLPVARARAARQSAPATPAPQRLAVDPPQESAAKALGPEEQDEAERDLIPRL